jgi:amino acid transporter
LFALGREGVLPRSLHRTARRALAPRRASLAQTLVAGLALAAAAAAGIGSRGFLPQRLAVLGGLGILLVLLATALSALLYLNRVPGIEGAWGRFLAPILSTVSLGTLTCLAFGNLPALLGVPAGDLAVWLVPGVLGGAVLLGVLHSLVLRGARPVTYAGVGQGGVPVVVTPKVPCPRAPDGAREPGAHRPERVDR